MRTSSGRYTPVYIDILICNNILVGSTMIITNIKILLLRPTYTMFPCYIYERSRTRENVYLLYLSENR